jgi:hypothetical protein
LVQEALICFNDRSEFTPQWWGCMFAFSNKFEIHLKRRNCFQSWGWGNNSNLMKPHDDSWGSILPINLCCLNLQCLLVNLLFLGGAMATIRSNQTMDNCFVKCFVSESRMAMAFWCFFHVRFDGGYPSRHHDYRILSGIRTWPIGSRPRWVRLIGWSNLDGLSHQAGGVSLWNMDREHGLKCRIWMNLDGFGMDLGVTGHFKGAF